jgi:hypothetical protein
MQQDVATHILLHRLAITPDFRRILPLRANSCAYLLRRFLRRRSDGVFQPLSVMSQPSMDRGSPQAADLQGGGRPWLPAATPSWRPPLTVPGTCCWRPWSAAAPGRYRPIRAAAGRDAGQRPDRSGAGRYGLQLRAELAATPGRCARSSRRRSAGQRPGRRAAAVPGSH